LVTDMAELPEVGVTVQFVVIYAEDLLAVRKFAFSAFAGSLYFFDIYPFSGSQRMALLRIVHSRIMLRPMKQKNALRKLNLKRKAKDLEKE
jgi:hypothetical protein